MIYSCDVFGISRQAYYKQKQRFKQEQLQTEQVVTMVRQIRAQMPRLGTRKLYHLLGADLPVVETNCLV